MKILVDDFLLVAGGAERCALTLMETFPDLDVVFGAINSDLFSPAQILADPARTIINLKVWQQPTIARILSAIYKFKYQSTFLQHYDTVLYSGCYAPVAVHQHQKGKNIYYCHTIPRFVYDLHTYYKAQIPFWQYPLFSMLSQYVQYHYEKAFSAMDVVLCNSKNVQQRIAQYLGKKNVHVVYPPVYTKQYHWQPAQGYYLSLARLEPYKRVDKIIAAFKQMPDKKLLISSGGSQLEKLKNQAKGASNIHFTGWLAEEKLRQTIAEAIACIYVPKDEDFGLSPVEAMAAGKPVIGVAEGGLLETIIEGQSGFLLPADFTAKDIIARVLALTTDKAQGMRKGCEEQAKKFDVQAYQKMMQTFLGYD